MRNLFDRYLHSNSKQAQFLRFATVGVKISLIDAGLVYLLPFAFGLNLYLSRLISLGTAILAGYLLNRYFTFGGHERGCFYRQMAGHFGVHLTGGFINYAIFSAIVTGGHKLLHDQLHLTVLPLIALGIGGFVGMFFNFIFSSTLVFKKRRRPADKGRLPEGKPAVAYEASPLESEACR